MWTIWIASRFVWYTIKKTIDNFGHFVLCASHEAEREYYSIPYYLWRQNQHAIIFASHWYWKKQLAIAHTHHLCQIYNTVAYLDFFFNRSSVWIVRHKYWNVLSFKTSQIRLHVWMCKWIIYRRIKGMNKKQRKGNVCGKESGLMRCHSQIVDYLLCRNVYVWCKHIATPK